MFTNSKILTRYKRVEINNVFYHSCLPNID